MSSSTVYSSPATADVTTITPVVFDFILPLGSITAATWTIVQTTAVRLDRSQWQFSGGSIAWYHAPPDNVQSAQATGIDLAAIQALNGSTLALTLTVYSYDLPLNITSFYLTLTYSGGGFFRLSPHGSLGTPIGNAGMMGGCDG
jgi:hypothetical protein